MLESDDTIVTGELQKFQEGKSGAECRVFPGGGCEEYAAVRTQPRDPLGARRPPGHHKERQAVKPMSGFLSWPQPAGGLVAGVTFQRFARL